MREGRLRQQPTGGGTLQESRRGAGNPRLRVLRTSPPYVEVVEAKEGLRQASRARIQSAERGSGVESDVLEGGAQLRKLREARPRAQSIHGEEVQVGEGAAELTEGEDAQLVGDDGERAEAREVPHPYCAGGWFRGGGGGAAAKAEVELFEEGEGRELVHGCAIVLDGERDGAGGRQDEHVEGGGDVLHIRIPALELGKVELAERGWGANVQGGKHDLWEYPYEVSGPHQPLPPVLTPVLADAVFTVGPWG